MTRGRLLKIVQIGQILRLSRGTLISFEIIQADEVYGNIIDVNDGP